MTGEEFLIKNNCYFGSFQDNRIENILIAMNEYAKHHAELAYHAGYMKAKFPDNESLPEYINKQFPE